MDAQVLNNIHNILRWGVLLFALLTLLTAARGLNGRKDFTNGDKRTALYLLIVTDLQLLLGLALYFMKPDSTNSYFKYLTGGGMKEVMHNASLRFFTVEHFIGMLVAVVLIHIGYAATKGTRPHVSKFRRLFWCTFVALVIILAMIPWPFRAGIGRPWLPGMA